MIDKRMKELLKELEISENSIFEADTDKIISGVKESINITGSNNIRHFKRKSIGVLPAVAVLVLMMAMTTFALGGEIVVKIIKEAIAPPVIEEPSTEERVIVVKKEEELPTVLVEEEETEPEYEKAVYEKYYKEEEEEAEEYIEEIYDGLADDNYGLKLNEIAGDSENIYLTITVEARTENAKILLQDDNFEWFRAEAFDESSDWYYVESEAEEDIAKRQDDSKCYWVHIKGEDSPFELGRMRITCRAFSPDMEERYVYFEVEKKREDLVEFDLAGQAFAGGRARIRENTLEITKQMESSFEYAPEARNMNVFFKLKNGTIKTFNQLVKGECETSYVGGDNLYKFSATANVSIDSLESVIVGDIEYPIDNPENYTQAYISSSLRPFVVSSEGNREYVCRLRDLASSVSVTKSETGVVEFTYGGNRYRAETGYNLVVINDSTEYNLNLPPYMDEAGDLWVGEDFIRSLLGIRYAKMESEGTYFMVP